MTKIEKFLDELRTAFGFAPTVETSVGNDQLAISVRSKTQGLKNCINCKQLKTSTTFTRRTSMLSKIKYHLTNALTAVACMPCDMLTFVVINIL